MLKFNLSMRSSMQFMIWCAFKCVSRSEVSEVQSSEQTNKLKSPNQQTNLLQRCCCLTVSVSVAGEMKGPPNYFLLKSARVKIHWLLGSYYLWALLLSWTHEMLPCSLGSPADYWMFYTCQEPVHRKLHSKCQISMIKGPGRAAREQIKFRKTHSCFFRTINWS